MTDDELNAFEDELRRPGSRHDGHADGVPDADNDEELLSLASAAAVVGEQPWTEAFREGADAGRRVRIRQRAARMKEIEEGRDVLSHFERVTGHPASPKPALVVRRWVWAAAVAALLISAGPVSRTFESPAQRMAWTGISDAAGPTRSARSPAMRTLEDARRSVIGIFLGYDAPALERGAAALVAEGDSLGAAQALVLLGRTDDALRLLEPLALRRADAAALLSELTGGGTMPP